MKTSRSERDYLFGSAMLTLRTATGLKQAELANLLGISRLAVGKWEGGINYPKAEHLKEVIALGVKSQAFPAGREDEEIRALWKAARQKMMLDEDWLSMLLSQPPSHAHVGADGAGPVLSVTDIRNMGGTRHRTGAVGIVPGGDPMSNSDPVPPHNRTRKQRQWLIHILTALVVLTIVEFGRSIFFAGKR